MAVLTYRQNSETQTMSNHFENLNLFSKYVSDEIDKLDYLHFSNFDLMRWYLYVFSDSKKGSLKCFDEYVKVVNNYANMINESNSNGIIGHKKGYSYKEHQEKLRRLMNRIGIDFEESSRTGFKEIEDQLIRLLDKINFSFINDDKLSPLPIATYK